MSDTENKYSLMGSSPLSQICHLPTLAADRPGVADLLKSVRFFSDKPSILSNTIGVPTLAKGSFTFSKLLGLPTSFNDSESLSKFWKSFSRK